MEWILIAVAAVGLGALATFVLATRIPLEVLERASEHGRFAQLGDAADAAADDPLPGRMSASGNRPRFGPGRARARHHADAIRAALRRRSRRAAGASRTSAASLAPDTALEGAATQPDTPRDTHHHEPSALRRPCRRDAAA